MDERKEEKWKEEELGASEGEGGGLVRHRGGRGGDEELATSLV